MSVEPIERLAFSPQEVADALGVTRQTVANWISKGTIRSVKIERTRRIPRSELTRLLGEEPL